jgi:hypothetical protein
MAGLFGFDLLRFEPRVAPRFDRVTLQRFDVRGGEHVADTARDHVSRRVHAQLSVARFERGLVPRPANFESLFLVASLR